MAARTITITSASATSSILHFLNTAALITPTFWSLAPGTNQIVIEQTAVGVVWVVTYKPA